MQNLDTDPGLSTWHVWWVRTSKPATINPVNSKLLKWLSQPLTSSCIIKIHEDPVFFFDCLPILHKSTWVIDVISHPYLMAKQLVFPASAGQEWHPGARGTLSNGWILGGIQMDYYWKWPSRNSGFSHWKWWFSTVMLVYQRVELQSTPTIHGSSAVSLLSL